MDESFEPGAGPRLTPAGKAKLDGEVIAKAKELSRVDLIVVSGHGDAMGFGQTLPVKQCPGEMPKGELAACLAPNRRIVMEVKEIPH